MDAVRKRLQERLKSLIERDRAITSHLRGEDGRGEEADWAERAEITFSDDVLERLDTRARTEIEQIRTAMQRLDTGKYGTCGACGKKIQARRLQVLPYTTRCVRCAA